MSFRIRETSKGFIVEKQLKQWSLFGLKSKWVVYIKTSGMDCAWYHSSYAFAEMNLLNKIKTDTIENSIYGREDRKNTKRNRRVKKEA